MDAVRALTDAGSRQAIRVVDQGQPPAEIPTVSNLRQTSHSEAPNVSSVGPHAPANSNGSPNVAKMRMPRPLSWLPTPRSRKNRVGRSFSALILTSTTNANVAQIEGVRCGELTNADIIQSTWNPQAGWIPDSSDSAEHVENVATAAGFADEIGGGVINGTGRPKSEVQRSRRTALSRLKGTIRGYLGSMSMARRQSISEKLQFCKLEEGSISSTARRRAEWIGLCKQKIRNLTGHGNVKRKPIENVHQLSAKNISERHHEEQQLLVSASMSSPGRLDDAGEYSNFSRDYTFGDLEKAFINAVDKLRSQQTSQQTPHSMSNPNRQSLLPGSYQQDPEVTYTRRATIVNKARIATIVNTARIHTTRPEPCAFSVSQASLVPTPTKEGRPQVNPLRCHPDVGGFAEQLVDAAEVPTPLMGTSTPRIEITKEEAEGLENAPIYSPSSGNLSQYSRLTPSPARSAASSFHTAPLLTPSNLCETLYYTLTRSSGRSTTTEYAAHLKKGETAARRSNPQQFSEYEQVRKEKRMNTKPTDRAIQIKTSGVGGGGSTTRTESPKIQEKPYDLQASSADVQEPGYTGKDGKETLEWSPYRVGNSKRIVGWAPLPSSPGYRYAPPGRTNHDFADASDEHLPSSK